MPIDIWKRLDSRYFETVCTKEGSDYTYHVVRPKDSPMVLFSLSDPRGPIPIASIHLKTQDYSKQNDRLGNRGRALITQRWRKSPLNCDFQGIITKDNQDYEFVLSNLTTGDDYVNINILKKNVKVTERDPGVHGHGLNAINEIRPYESYAVKCDQENNLSLILRSIKTSSGGQVSVKEDEKNGLENTHGTYYYLSVIAPQGSPTADLFKETVWACVDYFITMVPKPKPVQQRSYYLEESGLESVEESSFRFHGATLECACMPQSFSMESSRGSLQSASVSLASCGSRSKGMSLASVDDDDMIDQSYAATVDTGRHIQENIGYTGVDYDFEQPSVPCILGLSICENVAFYSSPNKDWIMASAFPIIDDYIANNAKIYVDKLKKVYKEENCCICLEEEPDTVIYQCGHQCLHKSCMSENVDSCPLCRGHITAQIKV